MVIPHVFHEVWFDLGNGPTPPRRYDRWRASWRRLHPDARFVTWDERSARALLRNRFAWFLPFWDAYRAPIYRVDAIRYFALLHHGGVYVDMDLECRRCLYPLLDRPDVDALVCRTPFLGIDLPTNFFMAARPGHPFVRSLCERLERSHRSALHLASSAVGPLWVTGPGFVAAGLRAYERVRTRSPSALPPVAVIGRPSVADSRSRHDDGSDEPRCMIVHHGDGSWVGRGIRDDALRAARVAIALAIGAVLLFLAIRCAVRAARGRCPSRRDGRRGDP